MLGSTLLLLLVTLNQGFPTRGNSLSGGYQGELGSPTQNCWNIDLLADLANAVPIIV